MKPMKLIFLKLQMESCQNGVVLNIFNKCGLLEEDGQT